MMAANIYTLCALTALACAYLLLQGYRRGDIGCCYGAGSALPD